MPRITLDDVEYNTEDLSDHGKATLASLQFLEGQLKNIRNEIVPYWLLAFLGLGISTIFVYLADSIWETWVAINLANAMGYTLLWGAKYFILEKYLFKESPSSSSREINSL